MDTARDRGIENRLVEIAQEIRALEIRLEISERVRSLLQLEAYKEVVAQLEMAARREVEALATKFHEPYEQGRKQGFIKALRMLGETRPMSEDESSHIRDVVLPDLRQKLEDGMNLLGGMKP